MFTSATKESFRISMLYAVFSALWIYFSDSLLTTIFSDQQIIFQLSIFKGWIFVILSATMLYYLIQRHTLQYEKKNQELNHTNFDLVAAYEELRALEEELRHQFVILEENQQMLEDNKELLLTKNTYMDALFGTTLIIVKRMDIHTLFEVIVERATGLADEAHAFMFWVDPSGEYLDLKAGNGVHKEMVGARLQKGEGLVGRVLEQKKGIMVEEYTTWDGQYSGMDCSHIGAMVSVPIYSEDKIVAVLGLSYERNSAKTFTEEKIKILEKFTNIVALSIDNALLADSLQRELEEGKIQQEKISYLAYHEPITGLYNRNFIKETFGNLLIADEKRLVVLLLDLDGFKIVNDIAGHDAGDNLLRIMGERLTKIDNVSSIANMGVDKFIIIYHPPDENRKHIEQMAEIILGTCLEPFEIDGYDFTLTGSIGIAIGPDDGHDIGLLIKNADIAMAYAKQDNKNSYHLYTKDLSIQIVSKMNLEQDLRQAIEKNELVLYYQPRVNITTGKTQSVEALVRWQHPQRGLIFPDNFIPLAEETGLIVPLGAWVLRTACQQIRTWQDAGSDMVISVNLSAKQFYHGDLLETTMDILEETGALPHLLELEITETLCLYDIVSAIETMKELRKRNIHIAMDDFGTGQSSLVNLKRLPIDTLKIDKSFIQDAEISSESASIVNAIIVLGKTMRLHITAEGVETTGQLQLLKQYGCDEVQGYLFTKPLPVKKVEAYFNNNQNVEIITQLE